MSEAADEIAFVTAVRIGELADEMLLHLQIESRRISDDLIVAAGTAGLDPRRPSSADLLVKFSARVASLADEVDSLLDQYRGRLVEIVAIEGERWRERTGSPIN